MISAGFPRFGDRVAVANRLDSGALSVAVSGTGGVVVNEDGSLVLSTAEIVAKKEVPKPPTGAQSRSLSAPISKMVLQQSLSKS